MSIVVDNREGYTILRIKDGVFIRDTVREMSEELKILKGEDKSRFLVDFSECDYISSEGMGAMSDLWKYCSSKPDGKMAVLFSEDEDNDVRYLFDTIGLSTIMKDCIFTNQEEAAKLFSK